MVVIPRWVVYTAGIVCLSTTSVWSAPQEAPQPNLIVIVADDMNWDDYGAYGHPAIHTPNLDALAGQGIRFEHAYLTCSSCSPSRSSILTGKYPHNTGAEQLHWPLPEGTQTFVGTLKEAGYYTAAAGKWHLGDAVRGDFHRIYEASTAGFVLPSGEDGEPAQMIAAQPSGCEDWERALAACPVDQPYFLWLASLDPHREYQEGAHQPPHTINDVIVPPYLPDTPEVRNDLRLYYDEIGRLDDYVGRLLVALEASGRATNTLIVFLSDNGRPFPRDKTTLYDGGIRTPLVVRWPGHLASGSVSEALISSVDLAPTLIELALGTEAIPAQFEGRSFVPSLLDPAQPHRQFAFAEDHWHDYEDHARAIVTTHFKLIRNDYPDLANTPPADAGRGPAWQNMLSLEAAGRLPTEQLGCFQRPRPSWELYDLVRDPAELHNVFDDPAYQPARIQLQTALTTWTARTKDYLPSVRTPDEFDRQSGAPDHSVRVRPRKSKLQMFGTNGKY